MTSRSSEIVGASGAQRLFGHPPGLSVLVATQTWAEFSYFGLQATLIYYMTSQLGFSQAKSSIVYGLYGAIAFFSPFFGGIICDRWIRRSRAVIAGGVLMMLGHFALALPLLFYPALALVAFGNGLFIPPLAVQIASLYDDQDPRKAHAFSAYYMGINFGALMAPLLCGSLGELFGWHWGFTLAGFGMLIGLGIYLRFRHLLPEDPRPFKATVGSKDGTHWRTWLPQIRILSILISLVILFRIAYEQNGNVIALWIRYKTDRSLELGGQIYEIPATWFQAINPLLIIALTPLLIFGWRELEAKRGGTNLFHRMSLGCIIATLAMLLMAGAARIQGVHNQLVAPGWVISYLTLLTLGELMIVPVGLTLVSSLAPREAAGMAMGSWYIAKFLGSLFAGIAGSYWGVISPEIFFSIGAASVLIAAIGLYALGWSRLAYIE